MSKTEYKTLDEVFGLMKQELTKASKTDSMAVKANSLSKINDELNKKNKEYFEKINELENLLKSELLDGYEKDKSIEELERQVDDLIQENLLYDQQLSIISEQLKEANDIMREVKRIACLIDCSNLEGDDRENVYNTLYYGGIDEYLEKWGVK